jgi:hypothetical protein
MSDASLVETIAGGMPTLDQVRALEELMAGEPQLLLAPEVLTHGQVSARAVLIPAGTLLTGCQTNFDNLCIVLGDITVTTDAGPRRITGFAMLPANRGTKRVGEAHADTWWITCHHTKLTDQRQIEDEMTDESRDLNSRRLALEHA